MAKDPNQEACQVSDQVTATRRTKSQQEYKMIKQSVRMGDLANFLQDLI